MPVFAAIVLRPLTVRVASSSPSVVRIPSDFSFEAAKAVKPSISEIGYVMILIECALSELTEAGCPCDDFAHLISSNFVATKSEKFTRNVLDFAHAQTQSHQLGAERHQTTAHQPTETAAVAGSRDRGFRTRNPGNQCLNFIGWPFIAKETKNDTDGFFSHNVIDAGLYGQPSNQFVHIALNRLTYRTLPRNILTFRDANYKR